MIGQLDPHGRGKASVFDGKALFEAVADLRPAKAHLALQAQVAGERTRPQVAQQPGAAQSYQQDHPAPVGVNDLHKYCQSGQDWQ